MLLERIYDEDLAQASYLIGCQAKGHALVVDPRRDIQVYLDLAAKNGMTITGVTETHIHADYLSGTRGSPRAREPRSTCPTRAAQTGRTGRSSMQAHRAPPCG